MKHLMAIWTDWPKILNWVDFSGFALGGRKRSQMVNVNITFADFSVCDREVESTNCANCFVSLDAILTILYTALILVYQNGSSRPLFLSIDFRIS